MKAKFLLLLLFAGALVPDSHAQQQQKFSVGLRTGVLGSTYWTAEGPSSTNRLLGRAMIGASVSYPVTDRLSLQAELNLAPKGDAWSFDPEARDRKWYRDVYNFIEIPVLARFKMLDGPVVGVYALGGFYVARALNNYYYSGNKRIKFDEYSKNDFGLQLGAGAMYTFGPGRLFGELRFSPGLKNTDAFLDGTKTRLTAVGLSVGYWYDFQ